jgi:hypothetical protein
MLRIERTPAIPEIDSQRVYDELPKTIAQPARNHRSFG